MRGELPGVMVSSTFYDLKEIRQQLAAFIQNELNYRALISESPSFPVDPDADAIENCRRRVEQNADVMVLVVGSRYGSVHKATGKSVTNLEYLGARSKAVPIYAFIEKRTLTLYEAWRSASGDARDALCSTIDDEHLFQFIDEIRSTDGVWMVGFETAAEIIASLRVQLAYQMHGGLELQRTLRSNKEREFLVNLAGKAFKLVLEKPLAWEYRLFAQALTDEVSAASDLRKQYDLGLTFGSGEHLDDSGIASWIQLRISEVGRLSNAFGKLVNETLKQALGPPGMPGDEREIVFVARQLSRVYREAIECALLVRRSHSGEGDCQSVMDALVACFDQLIVKIGGWGEEIIKGIEGALSECEGPPTGSNPRKLIFTLTLDGASATRLGEEIREFSRRRDTGLH